MKNYNELYNKNFELCFKFKIKNINSNDYSYVLGIMTNNGPCCFKTNEVEWNKYDVKKIDVLDSFYNSINWNIETIIENQLENVCYFLIDGNILKHYFGNVEEVVLPNNVDIINSYAFANNSFIKSVKGNKVKEIYHYAFKHNKKLEKMEFETATYIFNLFDIPNLNTLIIGTNLKQIHIEDMIKSNLKIVISNNGNESVYTFNDNLERLFLNHLSAAKEDGEEISIIGINNNMKSYSFTNGDKKEQYAKCISSISCFEKLYSKLPNSIKNILYDNDYTLYLLKEFPYGGLCSNDDKLLLICMGHIYNSLYHEIGHAIDYIFGNISQSDTFKRIYQEEKDKLYSLKSLNRIKGYCGSFINHVIENECEFFAECFQCYYSNDDNFKRECPKAYDFLNMFENEIKNSISKDSNSLSFHKK